MSYSTPLYYGIFERVTVGKKKLGWSNCQLGRHIYFTSPGQCKQAPHLVKNPTVEIYFNLPSLYSFANKQAVEN